MGNVIWLSFALPEWYFMAALNPFAEGVLTAVPALGALCLIVGVAVALARVELHAFAMAISPALSQAFVAIAGALRGAFPGDAGTPVTLGFLALQVCLVGYLIYRLRGQLLSAVPLAIFALSYAFFATFIAAMAFSDVWL
jgi:hypothetical protein